MASARRHSRYYAERYRHLPKDSTSLSQLPPVTKGELMARFDDWVADPAVTRAGVEAFVASPSRVGQLYLGRYVIWHSSGSTGLLAVFVQDQGAMAVYEALDAARTLPAWLSWGDMMTIVRRGLRSAGLLAMDGHYAGIGLAAHRSRNRPWRRRATRLLSVLSPIADVVRELNAWQPVILGAYASSLTLLADQQESGALCIGPCLLFSTSEPFRPGDRQRVERAFGCRVREN